MLLISCLLRTAQALTAKRLLCKQFVMFWAQPALRKLLTKKPVLSHQMGTHQLRKTLCYKLPTKVHLLTTLVVCLSCVVISSNFVRSYNQLHHCVFQR